MLPIFPKVNKKNRTIENINIDQLMNDHGSPLLVVSEKIIKEKYKLFNDALKKYYPNSQIAYSIKTNHFPGIIKVMKEMGCWAEATSGFEYWLARKINFRTDQIIFNGPDKKPSDLKIALLGGAMVNIDSQIEANNIKNLSKEIGKSVKIGLRVNAKIGYYQWSRFGFSLEDNEAYEMVKYISNKLPQLIIGGLHIHIGTSINEAKFYEETAEKISDFSLKIQKDFGAKIDYIDLGGGFGVPGSRWMKSPTWIVPEIDEFIGTIIGVINKKFIDNKPKLFFEPGRYLIDEAAAFLTKVVNSKNNKFGQFANADSSIYTALKSANFRHNIIDVLKEAQDAAEAETILTWVGGNSCAGNDFLVQSTPMVKLEADDILIFYNAGAYNTSKGEQWIHARPAAIMIMENGEIKCIRRKEEFDDMIVLDNL